MVKFNLLLVAVLFCSLNLFSQEFTVPQNLRLENAEDYALLEKDVLNAINWLSETSVTEQQTKRKEVNAFLLKWLAGCPYVHIEIKSEIVTFMGSSPELLMMFMGGWAKYSIETKEYDNKIAGSLAGIEMVITFYEKNKVNLPKDKNVEKYIKMKNKGTLIEYINKNA